MSKLDLLKEEIGWLKVVFGVFVAADLSVVAWLVQNYQAADSVIVGLGICVVLIFTYGIFRVNKNAMRKIKQLEKL